MNKCHLINVHIQRELLQRTPVVPASSGLLRLFPEAVVFVWWGTSSTVVQCYMHTD